MDFLYFIFIFLITFFSSSDPNRVYNVINANEIPQDFVNEQTEEEVVQSTASKATAAPTQIIISMFHYASSPLLE